jgi:hypothetical protein
MPGNSDAGSASDLLAHDFVAMVARLCIGGSAMPPFSQAPAKAAAAPFAA